MIEDHFGRHDCSKPVTGDAVTLGKREVMNESMSPVPVLRRLEQMVRNIGHNEIPVRFVKDELDVPGPGEFSEFTQEVWGINSAGLGVSSATPKLLRLSRTRTGLIGLTRAIAFVLSVKSDLQSSTFG